MRERQLTRWEQHEQQLGSTPSANVLLLKLTPERGDQKCNTEIPTPQLRLAIRDSRPYPQDTTRCAGHHEMSPSGKAWAHGGFSRAQRVKTHPPVSLRRVGQNPPRSSPLPPTPQDSNMASQAKRMIRNHRPIPATTSRASGDASCRKIGPVRWGRDPAGCGCQVVCVLDLWQTVPAEHALAAT